MDWLRDKTSNLADYLGEFFLDSVAFLAGAIAFVAFLVLVVWLGGWLRRRLGTGLARRWQTSGSATVLVENASRVVLFVLALILALGVVGVRTDALVTWIGVIVAALSIALQDVIKNLVAGFYLLVERPFRIGDQIAVSDQKGNVERIDLRVTEIRNERNENVLIPNYLLFSQVVVSYPPTDQQSERLIISGIPGDPGSFEAQLIQVVQSVLGDHRQATVEIGSFSPDGATAALAIPSPLEPVQRNQLLIRLTETFPAARVELTNSRGGLG
jgi:hypothetical protein